MTRVVEVNADQVRRSLWGELDSAGIDRDHFTALLSEHGYDVAVGWLEDHHFWSVRDAFGNAHFLLNGDIGHAVTHAPESPVVDHERMPVLSDEGDDA